MRQEQSIEQLDVELYLLCKHNPRMALSGGREAAHIFVIDMEKQLSRIPRFDCDLLLLAAQGYEHKQIARRLQVSPKTVSRHLLKNFQAGIEPHKPSQRRADKKFNRTRSVTHEGSSRSRTAEQTRSTAHRTHHTQ